MPILKFSYDEERDIFTINGIRYAGRLFRFFGAAPEGRLFEILKREDGAVTIIDHGPGSVARIKE